jgi:putative nucleotidyltransferase with HDIG domain
MLSTKRLSRAGRIYLSVTTAVGMVIMLDSLYVMATNSVSLEWFILAGLTLLSGSFTVRIPTTSARLSVSEIFVFAAVLLFGPAAATVIVVLDVLVVSLWRARLYAGERVERVLFNAAAASIAIWAASQTFYLMTGISPLSVAPVRTLDLVPGLIALASIYFLLNSFLIAWAIGFEKNTAPFDIWRRNFLWLSLNYFSGASVAILLLPYLYPANQSGFARILGILLPILAISYLTFRTALGRVDDANRHLTELNKLYLSTIETLAMAIDAKDQITHGHIRRVQSYAVGLAQQVGVTDERLIKAIEAAALLHDMGKLAVPEYILNKPGPLTPAEFEKIKLHSAVGADILTAIDFPYPVVPIVRHHHENWDGSGYPDGLKGSDIPIGARILSVVDCFDALTSDRPYRPRLGDKEAIRILQERRGTMYDPLVIDTFLKVHSAFVPTFVVKSSQSLSAITDAASGSRSHIGGRAEPLEDIAASSEETLTLFNLARELTGHVSVADIAEVLLRHLRRLVPSSLCVFYVYVEESAVLEASQAAGENGQAVQGIRIPFGERLSGWVGANRRTIRNSDPVLDFGDIVRTMKPRLRSCLSTPLVMNDTLVGVLSLYAPAPEAFTEEHERLLEIVARQIAPVFQRSLGSSHSVPRAYRDQLAVLPISEQSRQLAEQMDQFAELPTPTSLLYVECQELPRIALQHGRVTAEQASADLAQQLRALLRVADILFHPESDAFAVLLFQTDRGTADSIAARMRSSVQQVTVANEQSPVSLAVSVVSAPEDGTQVGTLLESARQRLSDLRRRLRSEGNTSSRPESIH